MNITIEDFAALSPLIKAYELQPGRHYLFVCDGKHFDYDLANALIRRLRENHPEIHGAVLASLSPKGIDVRETTLADELERLTAEVTANQTIPGLAEVEFPKFVSLINRAIKTLRGDHGTA